MFEGFVRGIRYVAGERGMVWLSDAYVWLVLGVGKLSPSCCVKSQSSSNNHQQSRNAVCFLAHSI
jgi:hypothetical protein